MISRQTRNLIFTFQTRSYFYTKYGELVSKPAKIVSKELYHPVLGKFASEIVTKPATTETSELEKEKNVVKAIERKQIESHKFSKLFYGAQEEKLTLGQVVLVKKKICLSKPQTQTFFGIVIEVVTNGVASSVRLRNIIHGTGVELLVPVFSPLIEQIAILRRPVQVPAGPNLFGIRDKPEDMSRFMDDQLMTDKGRIAFLKRFQQQQQQIAK